jgi:RNA polymerase sigma-70 factor (ECF subfamily)
MIVLFATAGASQSQDNRNLARPITKSSDPVDPAEKGKINPPGPAPPMPQTRTEGLDVEKLVERVAQGDRAAEAQLAEYLTPRLRVMMRAKTRDAELSRDLTQDAVIEVLKALRRGQLREPGRLIAFVHGVARNVANNYVRTRRDDTGHEPLSDLLAQPLDEADAHERRDLVTRGLAQISPSDREILDLVLVEGLKPGEIAARMGLAPEVVRTRKSRALKRILTALQRLTGYVPGRSDHGTFSDIPFLVAADSLADSAAADSGGDASCGDGGGGDGGGGDGGGGGGGDCSGGGGGE